jgi:hypothetical protein
MPHESLESLQRRMDCKEIVLSGCWLYAKKREAFSKNAKSALHLPRFLKSCLGNLTANTTSSKISP